MLHTDQPRPCSTDPEAWFPDSRDRAAIARAKAACLPCPRRLVCLEDAMQTEEMLGQQLHGIHGGLTPSERKRFKMKRIA